MLIIQFYRKEEFELKRDDASRDLGPQLPHKESKAGEQWRN